MLASLLSADDRGGVAGYQSRHISNKEQHGCIEAGCQTNSKDKKNTKQEEDDTPQVWYRKPRIAAPPSPPGPYHPARKNAMTSAVNAPKPASNPMPYNPDYEDDGYGDEYYDPAYDYDDRDYYNPSYDYDDRDYYNPSYDYDDRDYYNPSYDYDDPGYGNNYSGPEYEYYEEYPYECNQKPRSKWNKFLFPAAVTIAGVSAGAVYATRNNHHCKESEQVVSEEGESFLTFDLASDNGNITNELEILDQNSNIVQFSQVNTNGETVSSQTFGDRQFTVRVASVSDSADSLEIKAYFNSSLYETQTIFKPQVGDFVTFTTP